MASLLDTFRLLASFEPTRRSLAAAPWEDYVDWAIANGLAPLAAYNLEYRLGGAGAPEWAKDRLLSIYQGTLNDNVMKLVNFKRAVDELEGRQLILLGAASFAETLYPHVAFRPVLDLQLLLRPADLDGFANFLAHAEFRPADASEGAPQGATRVLSDGRTEVFLYSNLLGPSRAFDEERLFSRALKVPVYGGSMFRLDLEDAILTVCLEHARAGYDVPYISFVDLRELVLGAPSLGGPYSRTVDTAQLLSRAKAWRLERALYTSLAVVERLFPHTAAAVDRLRPPLRLPTRALLDRLVVDPLSQIGKTRTLRGGERLRALLAGGH